MFHQDTLILKDVSLDLEVEVVVHVLINLAGITVLAQHATEDTHATHPDHTARHTGFTGTTAFADTRVTSLALGLGDLTDTGSRVNLLGFLKDQPVLDKFANRDT